MIFISAAQAQESSIALNKDAFVQAALQSKAFNKRIKSWGLSNGKVISSTVEVTSSDWGVALVKIVIQSQDPQDDGLKCEIRGTAFYNPQTGEFSQMDDFAPATCS